MNITTSTLSQKKRSWSVASEMSILQVEVTMQGHRMSIGNLLERLRKD